MGLFLGVLSAYFGTPWGIEQLIKIGNETLINEYQFNLEANIDEALMPKMFIEEKSEITGTVFDVPTSEIVSIKEAFIGNLKNETQRQ